MTSFNSKFATARWIGPVRKESSLLSLDNYQMLKLNQTAFGNISSGNDALHQPRFAPNTSADSSISIQRHRTFNYSYTLCNIIVIGLFSADSRKHLSTLARYWRIQQFRRSVHWCAICVWIGLTLICYHSAKQIFAFRRERRRTNKNGTIVGRQAAFVAGPAYAALAAVLESVRDSIRPSLDSQETRHITRKHWCRQDYCCQHYFPLAKCQFSDVVSTWVRPRLHTANNRTLKKGLFSAVD